MSFTFGEPVQVLRAGVKTDPFSDEPVGLDWDNPTVMTFARAAVAPGASVETWQVGRDPVDTVYTVYLPYGADVTSADRVIARGETFEVNGDVAQWRNPFTGREFGCAVPLRRRSG